MKILPEVLDVLRGVGCSGNVATMPQLDRPLYVKVNKVLTCLGGKWDRKRNGHVFEGDPGDRLNDAITTGMVTDAMKEFQFFETPSDLADRMVNIAGIGKGHELLEPSAGKGAILSRILAMAPYTGRVVAIELHPKMASGLKESFAGSINLEVRCQNFLDYSRVLPFDRIVMNPPFRNGQDILHVMNAWSLLAPGGRLVALTAPGWTFRTDPRHSNFRQWVLNKCDLHEEIPAGTFRASGTDIRTMLIVADK